ncbi:MAG: permease [Alphaproteobacteria bacterium]|nr:permease [Alphaproteobacteria bacterium]
MAAPTIRICSFAITVVIFVLWGVLYTFLQPLADGLVSSAGIDITGAGGSALAFFIYEVPKVLLLLVLIVFLMGVVRTFFSLQKTRAFLSGRREGLGNLAAAGLGVLTPFCSCSAIPSFPRACLWASPFPS